MGKKITTIVAIILALCIVLSGCSIGEYFSLLGSYFFGTVTHFDAMEYTRPDLDAFRQALENCCRAAQTETQLEPLLDQILEFNAAYDQYVTARSLAMIYYCRDMRDGNWAEEYDFCEAASTEVAAGIDRLYRLLAQSPLRESLESDQYFGADFFDAYEGQTVFDDAFLALLQQQTQLQNAYLAIYADAEGLEYGSEEFFDRYGQQMGQLLVDLVLLRQQISAYAGYEDFSAFAYDFYYFRDYTPQQADALLDSIHAQLVPLYQQIGSQKPEIILFGCDQQATYNYVSATAQAMGGMIWDAFSDMSRCQLYDITPSEYKYNASFELFISGYLSPYVFLNPTQTEQDKLTFAHEFGHFCHDHANMGSRVGVDVAEIYSQAMEYLSLCYGNADDNLIRLKMLDCLGIYVEQAALASFEQQLYQLPAQQVTMETIIQLYTATCADYGIDSEYGYLYITHFYTNPLYIISYVVSNDAALQIYQMELQETGAGLACYRQNLIPWKTDFLAFLENAGLESPFAEGRLESVKVMLENSLYPQ